MLSIADGGDEHATICELGDQRVRNRMRRGGHDDALVRRSRGPAFVSVADSGDGRNPMM